MGTTFRVVLYARDEARADRAAEAALARIEALDGRLSDYDPESELSRLSRGEPGTPRPVSADLFTVLATAREVSARTGGAFDVTVGPLVRPWRRAARRGELPDPERLERARASVGWRWVELDEATRTVRLAEPGMRLDLGGIAKGYALDEALAVLREHGVARALVDGGGDVAASAPPPGRDGWSLGLDVGGGPAGTVRLRDAACATSGDVHRSVEIDGVRYSHVVDPRTGLGVTHGRAATVIAPGGATADAWASALCVLSPERGLALVEALPGVEARVWQKGGARTCDSSGFAERMAR